MPGQRRELLPANAEAATHGERTAAASRGTDDTVRDHLANERTLLAWSRTGVALMALGFVVSRFGLLLRELAGALPRHIPPGISTGFGIALVICGALLTALATVRYLRAGRAIDRHEYRWSPLLGLALSAILVLAAGALAAYLLLAS
jgi:putative membrane protein